MGFSRIKAFVLILLLNLTRAKGHQKRKPTLILISFDGFRWDYMQKVNTTTLAWLAKYGASAAVVNNFVTKTFPNHYSIVTGRYEENHGIINNVMWDPVYKERFTPATVDPKWFNASEPVWITNEKQGAGRLSAVINWVGGSVPFHGHKAYFSPPYNKSISFKTRMDMVLHQLEQDPPVNFVAVYFHEPDQSGHKNGPNSKAVADAIRNLDEVTGYLLQELKKRNLFDEVNIILTSDHGMVEVNSSKLIFLDDYISPEKYTLIDSGVNSFIIPNKGEENNIYKNLSRAPHVTVLYKKDIPTYWHYARSRRVTPIFVTSDLGYRIILQRDKDFELGDHGYNNSIIEMHPFFIAYGPAFKQGYQSKPFSIVHIYSLMCHILDIIPAANDGSLSPVSQLLYHQDTNNYVPLIVVVSTAALILMIMTYGVVRRLWKKSYRFSRIYDLESYS